MEKSIQLDQLTTVAIISMEMTDNIPLFMIYWELWILWIKLCIPTTFVDSIHDFYLFIYLFWRPFHNILGTFCSILLT